MITFHIFSKNDLFGGLRALSQLKCISAGTARNSVPNLEEPLEFPGHWIP